MDLTRTRDIPRGIIFKPFILMDLAHYTECRSNLSRDDRRWYLSGTGEINQLPWRLGTPLTCYGIWDDWASTIEMFCKKSLEFAQASNAYCTGSSRQNTCGRTVALFVKKVCDDDDDDDDDFYYQFHLLSNVITQECTGLCLARTIVPSAAV
jgi:hypothetical protein